MLEFVDQLHRTVRLENPPSRIVSLVPSQTELLAALGLGDRVVGITKFCIHPDSWWRTKTRVGGTKQLDFDAIRALHPDLIIANKEENTYEDIREAEKICPVWISDVETVEGALALIREVGKITQAVEESLMLLAAIEQEFRALTPLSPPLKALYFIWKNPYYLAGKNTFIDAMLERCGLQNACTESRYPELSAVELETVDVVLLSTEPFPFKAKHFSEFQALFPTAKVMLVDGEYFSWYGSRLKDAPRYFQQIIRELGTRYFFGG